ncbi:MAG: hypothetical protein ACE366_00640 [Bradymonadia bacterium]
MMMGAQVEKVALQMPQSTPTARWSQAAPVAPQVLVAKQGWGVCLAALVAKAEIPVAPVAWVEILVAPVAP